MTLGDGIRRNIAKVSRQERDLFISAITRLNDIYYPGSRTDFPAGHVSYWFKQDEIHQSTHVHQSAAFLPWHRELCNRFEALLRSVNPQLSLHYWDWNHDPSNMPDGTGGTVNLFDPNFMGNANGEVGEPLLTAGFYAPNAVLYRDDNLLRLNRPNLNDPSTWSYQDGVQHHYNPGDPPKRLTRDKQSGDPPVGVTGSGWPSDNDLVNAADWETFNDFMQGGELGTSNNDAHGAAHQYIGGTGGNLSDPHISFRDPFVFLLHSNVDRLWAKWQRDSQHPERLDPAQVYGTGPLGGNTTGSGDVEGEAQGLDNPTWGILSPLEPWAGLAAQTNLTGVVANLWPVNPWFTTPEIKNSKDPSVVRPPVYADP